MKQETTSSKVADLLLYQLALATVQIVYFVDEQRLGASSVIENILFKMINSKMGTTQDAMQ